MNKNIKYESSLDNLRICKFCNKVFTDGETEIEPDFVNKGLKEVCPYCGKDLSEFNTSDEETIDDDL